MQQFENFGFLVWYLYNQLTKHHRLGYEHTFSVPEFLPSSNMVIMAFRRQIEYKVIFILILHQNTIQGNSGLPSPPPPTHGSNRYPDIHNFQSPPWVFLVKSRNIQVGFGIGMVEDPVTDPKCPLIFVFWIPLSSRLSAHKLTRGELDHDCSAFRLRSPLLGKTV